MRLPGTISWMLLGLAGLAIAIGVAIAAANLTSRQIGIASESVSAGDALAPALQAPAAEGSKEQRPPESSGAEPTTTTAEESPPPEETAEAPDDHGGGSGDS